SASSRSRPQAIRTPSSTRSSTDTGHHRGLGMRENVEHLDYAALAAGLAGIGRSPADGGRLAPIVRGPAVGERAEHAEGVLDLDEGLVGDCWRTRGSRSTPDGSANPRAQLTVMNVRVAGLVTVDPARIPLAGDRL